MHRPRLPDLAQCLRRFIQAQEPNLVPGPRASAIDEMQNPVTYIESGREVGIMTRALGAQPTRFVNPSYYGGVVNRF